MNRRSEGILIIKIPGIYHAQVAPCGACYRRPAREDIDVASMSPLPNLSEIKPIRIDEAQAAIDYSGLLAAWKMRQER